MKVILFDDFSRRLNLLPLTFTRPVAALRIGILTIAEKWEKYLELGVSYQTEPYLQEKFPFEYSDQNILINGSICPDEHLLEAVDNLLAGEALYSDT